MLLRDVLKEYKFDCKARKLSVKTIDGYVRMNGYLFDYLEKAYGICEVEQVRAGHIKQFLLLKEEMGAKPQYINDLLKVFKCYFKYMELYISKHDDDEHSIMNEFEILLARDEASKSAGLQAAPFLKVKSWFLNKYPVFTQAYEKQTAILDDVAAKQKAAREAKQKEMLEARRAALLATIA